MVSYSNCTIGIKGKPCNYGSIALPKRRNYHKKKNQLYKMRVTKRNCSHWFKALSVVSEYQSISVVSVCGSLLIKFHFYFFILDLDSSQPQIFRISFHFSSVALIVYQSKLAHLAFLDESSRVVSEEWQRNYCQI